MNTEKQPLLASSQIEEVIALVPVKKTTTSSWKLMVALLVLISVLGVSFSSSYGKISQQLRGTNFHEFDTDVPGGVNGPNAANPDYADELILLTSAPAPQNIPPAPEKPAGAVSALGSVAMTSSGVAPVVQPLPTVIGGGVNFELAESGIDLSAAVGAVLPSSSLGSSASGVVVTSTNHVSTDVDHTTGAIGHGAETSSVVATTTDAVATTGPVNPIGQPTDSTTDSEATTTDSTISTTASSSSSSSSSKYDTSDKGTANHWGAKPDKTSEVTTTHPLIDEPYP